MFSFENFKIADSVCILLPFLVHFLKLFFFIFLVNSCVHSWRRKYIKKIKQKYLVCYFKFYVSFALCIHEFSMASDTDTDEWDKEKDE